jgi:alkylated DNA nucleotide flippase Atl1
MALRAPTINDYTDQVLSAVEAIPVGSVMTYGDLAELVGVGGPRQVGRVMALYGAAVPWWRVVRADGQPARGHESRALQHLAAEGTPVRRDRVQLAAARYHPTARSDAPESNVKQGSQGLTFMQG